MKKIMFNDHYGLTTAVISGCKTQTRRLVPSKIFEEYEDKFDYDELVPQGTRDNDFRKFALQYAPYKVGEIVAIAQQYSDHTVCDLLAPNVTEEDAYMIGFLMHSAGWENKMFVKSEYMPHQIKIIGVKVERLQDISDEDCLAEGVIKYANGVYTYIESGKKFFHRELDTPKKAFAALIDKINGKNTWERNPWVFAYSFTLIK